MNPPPDDIRMDPPTVRAHATQVSGQGRDLSIATRQSLRAVSVRGRSFEEVDELVHAFLRTYEPRAQQAEERAGATAQEFTRIGDTAVKIVDFYDRVDVDAAANLAREQGLLPPG